MFRVMCLGIFASLLSSSLFARQVLKPGNQTFFLSAESLVDQGRFAPTPPWKQPRLPPATSGDVEQEWKTKIIKFPVSVRKFLARHPQRISVVMRHLMFQQYAVTVSGFTNIDGLEMHSPRTRVNCDNNNGVYVCKVPAVCAQFSEIYQRYGLRRAWNCPVSTLTISNNEVALETPSYVYAWVVAHKWAPGLIGPIIPEVATIKFKGRR